MRDESHVWVQRWTGDWYGFDPTNDREAGDHHVVVASARDYRDVTPLSAVFSGSALSLDVSVKATQIA